MILGCGMSEILEEEASNGVCVSVVFEEDNLTP